MNRRELLQGCGAALGATALPAVATGGTAPVQLGTAKRLLWDDGLLERHSGVRWTMHPARRTGERCIVPDRPWEEHWIGVGGTGTLLHEKGRFRLWYHTRSRAMPKQRALAYAESTDGIHWEKPILNRVEHQGSRKNNLVLGAETGYNSGTIWIDPNTAPNERYKLVHTYFPDRKAGEPRNEFLSLSSSPDGFRWAFSHRQISRGFPLDTQHVAFWDDRVRKYVLFTRQGPGRMIARSESDTPTAFPTPVTVISPPNRASEDYYDPIVMRYQEAADAYIGLIPCFFHPSSDGKTPSEGQPPIVVRDYKAAPPDTLDIHLFTSADSVNWTRRGDHHPFIGLGPEGAFDSRVLWTGIGYAVVEDEIWFYYTGQAVTHLSILEGGPHGTITRATLRRDGFVSMDAGHGGAEIVTKPMRFTGSRLELNMDASAGGHLDVEIQDETGRALPGFSLKECDRSYHNHLRKVVSWQGRSDLSALKEKSVRLRIVFRDCRLYALQFPTGTP